MTLGYSLKKLLGGVLNSTPYFYLSWRYWSVWHDPAIDGEWVKLGVALFGLESLIAFSGAMMGGGLVAKGPAGEKIIATGVFYALFGFFLYPIALLTCGSIGWQLIGVYSTIMLTRLINGILTDDDQAVPTAKLYSFLNILLYVGLFFSTVGKHNDLWPHWGLTHEAMERWIQGWDHSWTQTPHRIFGAACVYYTIAGLLPLVVQFLLAWQGRIHDDPNVAAYREARSQDLKRWDEYRQLVAQRKKGLISQQEFEEKQKNTGY